MKKFKKIILFMVVVLIILLGATSCTVNMEQADSSVLNALVTQSDVNF